MLESSTMKNGNATQPDSDFPSLEDFDLDFNNPRADAKAIEEVLPHRGDMRQLDSVLWWSDDFVTSVGTRHLKDDEFWIPGHIPGRPLFPGVLMIETAAQLCSFTQMLSRDDIPFLGFTRCEDCAFRGSMVPGDEMTLIAKLLSSNRRRFISRVHGYCNGKRILEVTITGMVL